MNSLNTSLIKVHPVALPHKQIVEIGGINEQGDIVPHVRINELGCDGATCESVAPLPIPLANAVGAWMDGHIVICGGETTGSMISDLCYVFKRLLLVEFSACGGLPTGRSMPVLTAYFPVLAFGILGKGE